MADVRISTHVARTQNHDFAIIKFYDGLENLIGTDYVILQIDNDCLYFKPSEVKVKGSLKLGVFVNVWGQFEDVKPFEGEYSLEYDSDKSMYYVNKNRGLEITRMYGNHNVPHVNYKSHVNEPYVEEKVEGEIVMSEERKYSMVIYDGLLELLRIQISDLNKLAAIATLETIKSLLQSE